MRLIDALADVLKKHYQAKVNTSKEMLASERRDASGRLSASLRPIDKVISSTVVELDLIAEDYWKYIDKGVKGWQNVNAPADSPFQYKKKFIPISALSGAGGWIAMKGLITTGQDAKERNTALARVLQTSIPKKGIRATRFITDVFNDDQVKQLKAEIGKAHVQFTANDIRKNGNNDSSSR
jgi:hypothetical protein